MAGAARVGDAHTCPLTTGTVPHAGGVISGPGVSTVLIEYQPAAIVGDSCICVGSVTTVASGSGSVTIGYAPAARSTDATSHGGSISTGATGVQIG